MAANESGTEMDNGSGPWKFVNIISHPKELKHAANISTIRRAATLAMHRVKRNNRAKQPLAKTNVSAVSVSDLESDGAKRTQHPDWNSADSINEEASHDDQIRRSSSPCSLLDIPTSVDVRQYYTVYKEYPNQEYLLNHWTSAMTPFLLPAGTNHNLISNIWVSHALNDPLFMCTILLHAAVHLDMINQREPSRMTLQLSIEAARQMTLRLDSKDSYLQDTTIAAVVMMLATQILTRDLVEMVSHLNALAQMIEMKGGLNKLGMDGILHMSVKCVSIPTAMFQDGRPRFLQLASTICLEDLIINNPPDPLLEFFDPQEFTQMDIVNALFYLREEIRDLAETWSISMADPSGTPTGEGMKFAARRMRIEQALLLAGQAFATMHGKNADARLREACCIAGSIYVHTVLRDFPARSSITQQTLTKRLITCVEGFELKDWCNTNAVQPSLAALFWALSVGGTASVDLEERTWFISHLSSAVKRLKLRSWAQGRAILNCFLWEEKIENETWEGISATLQNLIVIE